MVIAPMLALCIVTAGSGVSLGVRAGLVGEVDPIIAELMVAMSVGQTIGQYCNPSAALVLQESWVCVSVWDRLSGWHLSASVVAPTFPYIRSSSVPVSQHDKSDAT